MVEPVVVNCSDIEMVDATRDRAADGEGEGSPIITADAQEISSLNKRRNWTTDDVAMSVLCGSAGGPYIELNKPSRKVKPFASETNKAGLVVGFGSSNINSYATVDEKKERQSPLSTHILERMELSSDSKFEKLRQQTAAAGFEEMEYQALTRQSSLLIWLFGTLAPDT
jgi:hypothetical protein